MISHINLGVRGFDAAVAFYSAVLAELGWRLKFIDAERPWAGWQPADAQRPMVLVGRPYDGEPAEPGNGHMVALLAPSRAAVDAFHTAALANGGTSVGDPGPRPEYHAHYYGAYVLDPDGNKLCACCHDPE
jgi:catechol 2,3-dioxygenase-like lactoylglutathione lyase family enzyme